MKKGKPSKMGIVRFFALCIGLLIGTLILHDVHGQEQVNSLLWRVEGNGIKPSYLYGTIHLLPQEDFELKEKVKVAFEESGQVVLELDMDDLDLNAEIQKHMFLPEGTTLQDLMSEPAYKELDSGMQAMIGTGLMAFNAMKPFVIQSALIPALMGGTTASYEGTFVQMAAESDKEIWGLETVAYQFGIFDQISYEEQINDIQDMVLNKDRNLKLYAEMVDKYVNEDVDGLFDLMQQELSGENEMELLLDKRNKNWIGKIKVFATDQPTFFAVGAGHLGGPAGVIALLKRAGYQVTPVH